MTSSVIPVFYLHTASEVLAIPEPVPTQNGSGVEVNSTKVTLVNVPNLEEGVGPASRLAVVTLMIAGTILQTRTIASGDVVQYTSSLYAELPSPLESGIIYVSPNLGNPLFQRRFDILRRLNAPDFEVVASDPLPQLSGFPPDGSADTRRTVQLTDEAMLRFPVREIVRIFSSVFFSANTVIAPSIATFRNFGSGASTAFIALPDESHIVLSTTLAAAPQALLNTLLATNSLIQPNVPWQPPIKMTWAGWTVFGVLSVAMVIVFLVSVSLAYGWYISQYL